MVEPLRSAIKAARSASPDSPVLYLSPQGRRFDQGAAARMADTSGAILLAGRYEGVDERLIEAELAKELDVSRVPVREALAKLVGQGLLVGGQPGVHIDPLNPGIQELA